MSKCLVFPINSSSAMAFSKIATDLGVGVIEATSEFDEGVVERKGVVPLPYVTEADFDIKFIELIRQEQIELVYTDHPAVWGHVANLSNMYNNSISFRMCNEFPFEVEWKPYKEAYEWADKCIVDNSAFSTDGANVLSAQKYANLYRGYHHVPGQSDNQKLMLLSKIARHARPGDIVEIGSLYGRSAFALAWLSKQYDIGPVICVDPWSEETISDQGNAAEMVNAVVGTYDWDRIFQGFIASLSHFDHLNYIRQPSSHAVREYLASIDSGGVYSSEFGRTDISGKISILHIDGNHKYEEVKQDVESWMPLLAEGGWLLLDDYIWAFGDGPKQVGDELMNKISAKTSFVIGDTLCIQL